MNFSVAPVLLLGTGVVATAIFFVHRMVRWDLAPTAHLVGRCRWLLMAALGAGVVAFTIKLAAIVAIAGFSQPAGTPIEPLRSGQSGGGAGESAARYAWTLLPGARQGISTAQQSARSYVWLPLPNRAPAPDKNPTTPQKVALGKRLFNDPILSKDQTISCAACHDVQKKGGADGRRAAQGIGGAVGTRNTPTVWNTGFQSLFFWDGRASSLEEQAKGPLLNPLEMGMPSLSTVVEQVSQQQNYVQDFATAFGADEAISIQHIVEAIAAYERSLVTPDTPYDRFVSGDEKALTDQQIRGMALFESFGCVTCHHGPNFSAASVFDNKAPRRLFPANPTPFETKYDLLEKVDDQQVSIRSAWRVPSLRNVALTGPWLHNGSVDELADVVRIMAAAQLSWSGRYLLWSQRSRTLREIDRPMPSDRQVDDIVAFLHALTSDRLL